jgi:hemoglobin-like flavoprotein
MVEQISYQALSNVLSCWQNAQQKHSCREHIGNAILLQLFNVEPEIKLVFGFTLDQTNIENNPMLRMGLMVHGLRIMKMIDQVLELMGPDTEVLNEILQDQVQRHKRYGVKKEHFAHMGTAIRGALSNLLDKEVYTADVDRSWKEMFDKLTTAMIQSN